MCLLGLLLIFVVAALVFPIVFLLGVSPVTRQVIALVAFAMVTIGVVVVVFAQKIYRVATGVTVGGDMSISKSESSTSLANDDIRRQIVGVSTKRLVYASEEELARKRPEEAVLICNEQLDKWRVLLVRAQTRIDSSDQHSSSYSHGPSSRAYSPVSVYPIAEDELQAPSISTGCPTANADDAVRDFHHSDV